MRSRPPHQTRQHKDAIAEPNAGQGTAQRQPAQNSPRMVAQSQLKDSIQRSPRMNAQHKELAILSGQQAQWDEEDEKRPAQAKLISTQLLHELK